ncbi:MAG: hypothetical protein QM315_07145 [Bacillota bacterium]|nr:hypothetical protein [Bacillota bacterium]
MSDGFFGDRNNSEVLFFILIFLCLFFKCDHNRVLGFGDKC